MERLSRKEVSAGQVRGTVDPLGLQGVKLDPAAEKPSLVGPVEITFRRRARDHGQSFPDKAMTSRLMCVTILVLVAHLVTTDAAVRLWGMQASGLHGDPIGPPDPYLKVWCGTAFGGMTEFYKDNSSPTWNAEFYFPNCNVNDILKLEVWDKDLNFDDHLGTCTSSVLSGTHMNCGVGKGSLSYYFELK